MCKRIIMIAGYAACGKTTFSQSLAKELGVPVFNKDYMKAVLGNYIDIPNREESKRLSNATFGLMVHVAENLMKAENPFIIESNFKGNELDVLKELITKYEYRSLSYVLIGDLKVIHKRFVKREKQPERDAANRIFGLLDDFTVFEKAISTLGDFNVGDEIIRIDTTRFQDVDFGHYVQKAREFIGSI